MSSNKGFTNSVLGSVGFSSKGPVAGSFASSVQSHVYGGKVSSGSFFSGCQSKAMRK